MSELRHGYLVPTSKHPDGRNKAWKCMDCGEEGESFDEVLATRCLNPQPPSEHDSRLLDAIEGDSE